MHASGIDLDMHIEEQTSASQSSDEIALSSWAFGLLLIVALLFPFCFIVAIATWGNDYYDINNALNDQFDIFPWINWMVLFPCLIGVVAGLSVFITVWNLVKYTRLNGELHDNGVSGEPSRFRRVCCGKGGRYGCVVALAFWILAALVPAVCVFGFVAFYSIYGVLEGEFNMFVYWSMPIAQPLLLVLMLLLLPLVLRGISFIIKLRRGWIVAVLWALWWLGLFLFLIIVAPAILLPQSPNVRGSDQMLAPKPRFMAHRLGAGLGPENTLCALRRTIQVASQYPNQLFGVEFDVRYSYDGVPFLLHDTTFRRTTNIASFGNNGRFRFLPPYELLYREIQLLDAGSWYVDSNPWGQIGSQWLSQAEAESYRGCQIPTMRSVLETIKNSTLPHLKVMWNVRGPRPLEWVKQLGSIVNETGMQKNTIWLTSVNFDFFNSTVPDLMSVAPGITDFAVAMDIFNLTYAQEVVSVGFQYMNSPLQMPNDELAQSNLTNIVYQCNLPWLFNQLWLAGNVQLIASNVWETFLLISEPEAWTISRSGYLALFIIVDVVAIAVAVLLVLLFYRKRVQGKGNNIYWTR